MSDTPVHSADKEISPDHPMRAVTGYLGIPDLPPRPLYPIEAEAPIIEAFENTNRRSWITCTPTAIATTALTALRGAGWRIMPPATRSDASYRAGAGE